MEAIQNKNTIKEVLASTGLSAVQQYPSTIANQIIPVINVNPKDYINSVVLARNALATSGDVTIMTTSSTRSTFLTGLQYSMIKDATCSQATGTLSVYTNINGKTVYLCDVAVITLTAQNETVVLQFDKPIKLDKNVTVIMNSSYGAGVMSRTCILYGYELDTIEA